MCLIKALRYCYFFKTVSVISDESLLPIYMRVGATSSIFYPHLYSIANRVEYSLCTFYESAELSMSVTSRLKLKNPACKNGSPVSG